MYKRIFITFLIFFAPIALVEQHKNTESSKLAMKKFNMIEKTNLYFVDSIFEANKENSIEIRNCWEEGDLPSQKRYCSSSDNFINNL